MAVKRVGKMTAKRIVRFTLMEMVVVVAILALLGGIATPMFLNNLNKARVQTAKTQIQMFEQGILSFQIDTGKLPKSLDDLIKTSGEKKWNGPYMDKVKEVPKDPWGNAYVYSAPGSHGDFDIISYGADGAGGGDKFNADIGNWIESD